LDPIAMAWAALGASGALGLTLGLGRRIGLATPDHALLLGHLVAPGHPEAPRYGLLLMHLRGLLLTAFLAWVWRLTELALGPPLGSALGGVLGLYLGLLQRPASTVARWLEPAATRPVLQAVSLLEGPDSLLERSWRILAQMVDGATCGAFLGLGANPGVISVALLLGLAGTYVTLTSARPRTARPGTVLFLREDPEDQAALLRWSGESPASQGSGEQDG
jgi:hypothetical protein